MDRKSTRLLISNALETQYGVRETLFKSTKVQEVYACSGDRKSNRRHQIYPLHHGLTFASDGVLNPSGVRFGSAEIYAVTDRFDELEDSICVGQRRKDDSDEQVLLFVKPTPGHLFSTELASRIKAAIKEKYSAKHVPKYIFEVADIPYTVNGKKCEINVKQIVSGVKTAVSGTVANPESLRNFEPYVDLRKDGTLGSREQKL